MNAGKISTKHVLTIIGLSGIIIGSLVIPSLPIALGAAVKAWKNVNKKDLGRIIKRLKTQEMINIADKDGKITIKITEKGKARLLEYDFENIKLKSNKRDGKWRLILFDIPEKKKNARDVFRRKLIQLGFIKLQESVFACAYPCKNEIDFLCHFLQISDFVTIAQVSKIERGENLTFKPQFDGYN